MKTTGMETISYAIPTEENMGRMISLFSKMGAVMAEGRKWRPGIMYYADDGNRIDWCEPETTLGKLIAKDGKDILSDESQSKPDDFEFGKLYYLIGEYDYGILVNLITEEEKTFYVLAKLSDGSVIKKAGIDIDPADRTDTAEIMRLLRKTNPMYSIE